ncbi:MAG: SCP2 sterol-binding domain-containing protein [Gammaproteobacteria bacterium]
MKLPAGLISGLDMAINRYLRLDPETLARMGQLDAHCIAIELRGLDLTLYALPGRDGLTITDHCADTPDTTISGTPIGLARIGLGRQKERALFSGEVEIRGNVESGQAFQDILEGMDIDWEEQLSQLTGDVVAHNVGNVVRRAGELLRQGSAITRQNTTEYLQEELRVLPARIEIDNFCADVTQLAMDVDRLAARVARLEKKSATPGEQA